MTIVLKVGGELLADDREEARAIARDVRVLAERGDRVVVVHGGGPQATALQKRLGIEPRLVAGRRVTDESTLDVMKMVIAGQVNVEMCALLVAAGVRAVGLHGASGPAIRARRRPPRVYVGGPSEAVDLGHVGDVVGFDLGLLARLSDGGYVPVLAGLGCDETTGAIFNINADIVATRLAAALSAEKLFLMTGVPGVLADANDPSTRIARLTRAEADRAIADGRVKGGMIPKLTEAFQAVDLGVSEVHIVGGLRDGDMVRACDSPGAIGTVLLSA